MDENLGSTSPCFSVAVNLPFIHFVLTIPKFCNYVRCMLNQSRHLQLCRQEMLTVLDSDAQRLQGGHSQILPLGGSISTSTSVSKNVKTILIFNFFLYTLQESLESVAKIMTFTSFSRQLLKANLVMSTFVYILEEYYQCHVFMSLRSNVYFYLWAQNLTQLKWAHKNV